MSVPGCSSYGPGTVQKRAQLLNVKEKDSSKQQIFVDNFLHFAVQEYTALLYGFYKQNYVFGNCL